MEALDWATFISVIVGIVIGLVSLLYYSHKHSHTHGEIRTSIQGIEKRLDKYDDVILGGWKTLLDMTRSPELIKRLQTEKAGTNPYDPARKRNLLDRYSRREMELQEAMELQEILQEDLGTAQGIAAVAIILLSLAGLGALIYALMKR